MMYIYKEEIIMTTTTKVAIGIAAVAAIAGGYYAYKRFGDTPECNASEPMCEVGGLDAEDTVTTVDLNEAAPGVE